MGLARDAAEKDACWFAPVPQPSTQPSDQNVETQNHRYASQVDIIRQCRYYPLLALKLS